MTEIAGLFILIYAVLVGIAWLTWIKKPTLQLGTSSQGRFSIVIPFRNEAANLPRLIQSIKELDYPIDKFELLLVDDDSTDASIYIVTQSLVDSNVDYQILTNPKGEGSPKKRAITTALQYCKYELIACTDADCAVGPQWLTGLDTIFQNSSKTKFISGPVAFFNAKGDAPFLRKTWNKLQQVEFASLIGSGACSILLGQPNMCSGANIAYKKEAFDAVNGFVGNEHLASGDDEFLLHKIAGQFPSSVAYLKHPEAVVYTEDQESLGSFYQQRKRWASKWSFYQSLSPKLVAIFVFLVNLFTIYAAISGAWVLLSIRVVAEIIFLATFLSFWGQKKAIPYILPLQVIYPFYVLIFGLSSLTKSNYNWKDRSLA